MGLFRVRVVFANLDQSRQVEVDAIVDSGAVYSKLPRTLAAELGLIAVKRVQVRLGDNRLIERELAPAWLRCSEERAVVMVALGGEGEPPLLGATSLQALTLVVDSTNERLVPAEVLEMVQGPISFVQGRGLSEGSPA